LGREEPRWNEWMARRERTLSLDGERRMAEQAVVTSSQDFQRLDKELANALGAREQLRLLAAELAPVARLKEEVAALERLQRETAARRTEEAQRRGDCRSGSRRSSGPRRRSAPCGCGTRQYAETKRTELLKLYEEVKEQRDQIVKL